MSSIQARTVAEAMLFMAMLEREPVGHEGIEVGDATRHRFVCAAGTGDGIETLEFTVPRAQAGAGLLGGPEPSTIIEAEQFLATADRLSETVPLRPIPLVPKAVQGCLSDLELALACVQEAFRFIPEGAEGLPTGPEGQPGPTRRSLFSQAKALRARYERWQGLLAQLIPAPSLRSLPPPRLDRATLRGLRDSRGQSMQRVLQGALGPWAFVARDPGPPERALFRHPSGVILWITVRNEQVERTELVEGTPALEVHASHCFRLSPRQRLGLRALLTPGQAVEGALAQLRSGGVNTTRLMDARAEGQVVGFHRLDTLEIHRSACLLTVEDEQGRLLGHRVLEGPTALQQLEVLAEAAPQLPSSSDPRPEMRDKILALSQISIIAAAARQLLHAMVDPRFDIRQLQPRDDDYVKVFREPLVQQARGYIERRWRVETPRLPAELHQRGLAVAVCPSGAFEAIPELRVGFPGEFLALAPQLAPGFTWVAWRDDRDRVGDGLVWIEDHWAWFPGLGSIETRERRT